MEHNSETYCAQTRIYVIRPLSLVFETSTQNTDQISFRQVWNDLNHTLSDFRKYQEISRFLFTLNGKLTRQSGVS